MPGPFWDLSGEMYFGVLLCALFIKKNPVSPGTKDKNGLLFFPKALFFFTLKPIQSFKIITIGDDPSKNLPKVFNRLCNNAFSL